MKFLKIFKRKDKSAEMALKRLELGLSKKCV